MPRNRVIYANEALFASTSPATGSVSTINQIHRLQSANYNWNVTRTDVNQYGQQGRIDSVILEPPTVTLDFSYLLTNLNNESGLGFTVNQNTSCISGFLSKAQDDRNYFITLAPQGQDDIGYVAAGGTGRSVVGFGNGFITSYRSEASVGAFATASVSVEALNARGYLNSSGQPTPAISPSNGAQISGPTFTIPVAVTGAAGQASALRPGDIVLNLTSAGIVAPGIDTSDIKPQSYSLNVELGRENLNQLGTEFAYSKELTVPINATLSVEALAGDISTGSVANLLCNDQEYNLTIQLYKPACAPATGALAVQYTLKGCKLDSTDWSSSIGPAKTVTLNFSTQVGGPQDIARGVFMSGLVE